MKKYLKYICSCTIIFMITILNISCSKDEDAGLVYGNDSAPIVIENYTSFQCPDCSGLHLKLDNVLKKYIEWTIILFGYHLDLIMGRYLVYLRYPRKKIWIFKRLLFMPSIFTINDTCFLKFFSLNQKYHLQAIMNLYC